ncbi:1-acyl-sn-glycerol-3-phosphate acyltransferase 2 [Purpureocillium lilacinum]|uniref:1-acyl-sn-glycerol-3-phosphate acyltransferase 2 n=1 Tax=Purpureocillium lilacinum TaxID=33203 RepID=A0A179HSN6_PURLI|nr:1-acyl-sn-glycerol-3-phosphate acyltransferase 2 [Purpureocillium lilacinum]OAQ92571.1 1-acyl-sn-glycerol-3-phosphate acyltransferase 2 [Purpureocillium lilacinum]
MADGKHPGASGTDLAAGVNDHGVLQRSERRLAHPSGKEGYGRLAQVLRGLAFTVYFTSCCLTIVVTQFIGAPLYFINRDWFYAYMAMTKRSFALTTTVMTQIWGPTTVRISGDESVAGQIKSTGSGGVQFSFPERLVLIANHQIYTDWLYLWWIGYVNQPAMHGHLYIILKESLRYIPLIGTGMMFYGFIFMSRKMATDQPRLAYRLNKLKQKRTDPKGKPYLDPMWLLLFPEGTNLSGNGRRKSGQWAEKNGLKDPEHVMLPRSTGSFFCLNELRGTLDYVYDCTVAYEGIPRGKYGEEIFGLSSTYFQGRPPKSINLYWRRFRMSDIPLDDQKEFDLWLREQWYKKDELMEEYLTTGRFPPMAGAKAGFVETSVRTRQPWEILQVFTVVGICGLLWNNVRRLLHAASKGLGF